MKIPKSIKIIGRSIGIDVDPNFDGKASLYGIYRPHECKITLAGDKGMSDQQKDLALYHELTHAIFDVLDYKDLYGNEQIINQFAEVWFQINEQLIK